MQAYSACDVFCLPTGYEGTSQAIFEAMTQSKPIVATRTGGIPYQLEDETEGYLVDYGDLDALSVALSRILRDRPKAEEMGSRARAQAMRFQYPSLAAGLQSIYEEIVQSNGN
jgi:glycosyltransferase involved in cell wall biosynthesis